MTLSDVSAAIELHQAREALLNNGTDPVVVTKAHRAIWKIRTAAIGLTTEVTDCIYSRSELETLAAQGRRPGFLPATLATRRGRTGLATTFPRLQSWAVRDDTVVTSLEEPWGWFDYETAIDAPNVETDEADLLSLTRGAGRTLLDLNQYIVASQDSFVLLGRYLDDTDTWSRISAQVDGHLVACRFDGPGPAPMGEQPAVGCLLVGYDLDSGDRGPVLGGRSSTRVDQAAASRDTTVGYRALPVPSLTPDDLPGERRRILARYVELGFHEHLGLADDDYISSFPDIGVQPTQYRGRFDVPLLVETRIDWRDQADLADIARGGGSLNLAYRPVDRRSAVLPSPYAGWFTWWGQRFHAPIAPDAARTQLATDEVGANLNELIAFHIAHPELNESGRFFEPLGYVLDGSFPTGLTGFDDDILRTACMYRWRGRPEIGANLHPSAFSVFRPLLRGTVVAR